MRARLCAVGCAFLPAVVVILLVRWYFHRSLLGFTPVWSDEVGYWREIYTFHRVGFDGGYYTVDEYPARAGFTHFGAHGPAYAMLMSPVTLVIGWGIAYAPVLNLACLAAATAAYSWMTRLDRWQLLLATLSILVFWPILLYAPTSMQEAPHQALAILLAGFFCLLLRQRDGLPTVQYVLGAATLLVASVLRPTWAPLVVALLVFRARVVSVRRIALAALVAAPVVVVMFVLTMWLSSPYPNSLSHLLEVAGGSPAAGVRLFRHHLKDNVVLLFHGEALERALRYQLLAILVLAVTFLGYGAYRKRASSDDVSLFHVLNLGPALLVVLAAYDVSAWRDFRVFAPHVLASILVSVPFARRSFVLVPLALNAVFAVAFAGTFRSFHGVHFSPDARRQSLLAHAVAFQPGADPWRNTLLIDTANYTPELLQLPAGVGVSFILVPGSLQKPIKSRYLLITDDTLRQLGNPPGLRLLGTTPHGKLYVRQG
jgi:hypothetical protein